MSLKNCCELTRTRMAIAATLAVAAAASAYYVAILFWGGSSHPASDTISFFVTAPLIYGNLIYQAARLGALKRANRHRPAQRRELERFYDGIAPSLTILIPSFKEQPQVLRQTVLSAALAEYPGRRIVVLIDDPPDDRSSRAASWAVIHELNRLLAAPARRFAAEREAYRERCKSGEAEPRGEQIQLAGLYRELGRWFESLATVWESRSDDDGFAHANAFFVDRVLLASARSHHARAAELLARPMTREAVAHEYARLAELLRAEISGFERKTYVNLSHAPNKAMNLNAYIGLLGGSFRRVDGPDGMTLMRCTPESADLRVPDTQFLLTLDADSVILPDYTLHLMRVMQDDDRVAVAQTPYSAFPDAPTLLERTAGATTDIQYIAHQGSSHYDAAYWVGANALLRVSALRDIRTLAEERGHAVPVFIQERTVIEDTGSTIDLIRRGWKVHNYPDRLAYSATPSDFGALVIQRRRWSNGGLLILPDLIRFWQTGGRNRDRTIEVLVRLHYLVSPATGSLSVLTLLLYPFDFTFSVIWLPLAAAPYYFLYGRDLVRSGYVWSDLLRVYALNLLLLPVNMAGVLLSIRQAATGAKAPFGRTPKVKNRIAVPPLYSGFNVLLCMVMVLGAVYAVVSGNYARALFPLFNGALYAYGLVSFIGLRQSWSDALLMIRQPSAGSGNAAALSPPLPAGAGETGCRRAVTREMEHASQGGPAARSAFAYQSTHGRRQDDDAKGSDPEPLLTPSAWDETGGGMKRTQQAAWMSALIVWAPSAATAEPLNRVEVDSTASAGSFSSYYGDLSVTVSPFAPYYESGFKLRFSASDANYSYPGDLARTFISKGNDIETDFLLGYGFQFNRWSLTFLAGPSAVWSRQMPGVSLFPSKELTNVGAKTVASVYATPTDQTMLFAQAGVNSVNSIYFAQAKFGGALWPSIYIGPETSVLGRVAVGGVQPMANQFSPNSFDITIQQWRVGAFLSGLQVGPMTFGVSGGFLNDLQQGNGAYVSTSARTTF